VLSAAVWLGLRLGPGDPLFDQIAGLFLSAALVSFGGAYAVLPYVAGHAVDTHGWLSAGQMLNGLALAEATPGPLILVNTYTGFFAGWTAAEGGGTTQAILTGILATFYTFAPSFMLILAVAAHVERVTAIGWIRQALAGVTAAIVGVIANLAIYLGQAALLPDGSDTVLWPKAALFAALAGLALARGVAMHWLILTGAGAGLALHLAGAV